MVTLADKIRAMQLYYPEFGMSIGELGVWTFRWGKSGCLLMEGRGDTFVRGPGRAAAVQEVRRGPRNGDHGRRLTSSGVQTQENA
jgi:hypothetical protein